MVVLSFRLDRYVPVVQAQVLLWRSDDLYRVVSTRIICLPRQHSVKVVKSVNPRFQYDKLTVRVEL